MVKNMYQKREERKNKPEKVDNNKTSINWYPGHMAKTKRLITENLNLIDIVYELVDSRIPHSSKVKDIENYIKNKPRVLIFTKYDLCDKTETNKWMKKYTEEGYHVIALNLEENFNSKQLINLTNQILEQKFDKIANKGMLKRRTRVLIVGIPNVGKSTLINKLSSKKVTNVGNRPGVTKQLNWIRVNEQLELLDTPGILWPKIDENDVAYNLATFTAIKEEILPITQVVYYIIRKLYELYPNILKERYKIENIDDMEKVIEEIGKRRGCLIKGGIIDYEKVYMLILNDIKCGNIKGITFDREN